MEPEEVALVLQFGKYVRTSEPGLHLKLPFGIETARKVPVQRQFKEEFGFRTLTSGGRSEYATRAFGDEASMLTGDLNAATVEWVVQYRITSYNVCYTKLLRSHPHPREQSPEALRYSRLPCC